MKKLMLFIFCGFMVFGAVGCANADKPKTEEHVQEEEELKSEDVSAEEEIQYSDEEITASTKAWMESNFGYEEFAASWYKNILELEVYFEDSMYKANLTTDLDDDETIHTMCMAVFQFRDARIDIINVMDADGYILDVKTNTLP